MSSIFRQSSRFAWPFSALVGIALLATGSLAKEPAADLGHCQFGLAYGQVINLDTGARVDKSDDLTALLASVLACASASAGPEALRALPDELSKPLAASTAPLDPEEALVALDIIAATTESKQAQRLSEVAWQLAQAAGLDPQAIVAKAAESNEVLSTALENHAPNSADAVQAYRDNCRGAGVPVPGAIETDPGWKWGPIDVSTDVENKHTLAATHLEILTLWKYEDSNDGTCVALLREDADAGNPDDDGVALGVICQNKEMTQACFYDSVVYENGSTKRLNREAALTTDFAATAHIDDVKEKCILCHIGDNPLIVFPGTKLGDALGAGQSTRHRDFQFVDFGNGKTWCNPKPYELPHGVEFPDKENSCQACHDIPQRSRISGTQDYCTLIGDSAGLTMPPSHLGKSEIKLWPDTGPISVEDAGVLAPYLPSMLHLFDMCRTTHDDTC